MICAVKMNCCSFLEITHSTEIAVSQKKAGESNILQLFMAYIETIFFNSVFLLQYGGYWVFLSKVCVQAHLITTDLLREGCFSVQRPGRFDTTVDTNIGPQCELNNCYRGFLSSFKCWSPFSSPGINSLPPCLIKSHCHWKWFTLA